MNYNCRLDRAGPEGKVWPVLATIRATVLPDFSLEVYPTYEPLPGRRPGYILALSDGTAGSLQLLFPRAQDLRAFLALTREAFACARQEAKDARLRQQRFALSQSTLF